MGWIFERGKDKYIAISQAFNRCTESGSHGLRGIGVYNQDANWLRCGVWISHFEECLGAKKMGGLIDDDVLTGGD